LHHQSAFGTAVLVVFFSAGVCLAQSAPPDSDTSFPATVHQPRASDFKPVVSEPVHQRKLQETKSVLAGRFPKKQFVILSVAVYGASLADIHQTLQVRNYPWWYETDPLARPFVHLPAPAYYATGLAMATGLNWLSWKMGHSRRWHKLSALPQLFAIGGNIYGFKTNHF
jgi:hypothetical protein